MIKKQDINTRFLIFLISCFSLIHLSNIFFYKIFTIESMLVLGIATVFRFMTIKNLSIVPNLSVFILWVFLELSFSGYYFLNFFFENVTFSNFSFLIGQRILLVFFTSYFLFNCIKFKRKNIENEARPIPVKAALYWIIALSLTAYALSILSFKLGITQMGIIHQMLPYKLEPLLNLSRSVSIPIFFVLSFHYFYSIKKIRILTFLIYVSWLFFEIYIRGSRGVLLSGLLPFLIYSVKKFPLEKTIKNFFIFLMIGFIFFPIGKILRHGFSQTNQEISFSANHEIWDFYTRIFNDSMILKDFSHTFGNDFFANRYQLLQSKGGAERYYTKVIIGSPDHTAHSQGLTALSDGFIYFGQFGAYITIILLTFIALAIDVGQVPIINANIATQSLASYGLLNWLVWGEGFWDFYFTRSILTICVFPITLYLCYKLLEKFYLLCGAKTKVCNQSS